MRGRRKTMSKAKLTTGSASVPYFSLTRNYEERSADLYIFGDIAQRRGGLAGILQPGSDQSSHDLANQIADIPEDWEITVHINSNGGELKEGLGIYNTLKSRNVTTICEGFAASAGSVIFCAGKKRIMQPASLLFIHQASMLADGNADDHAKAADDLRIVTEAAMAAYRECGINIDDDQLLAMLRAETWITPEEAVEMGFATQISEEDPENGVITNDAMRSIMDAVKRRPEEAAPVVVDEPTLDVMREFANASKEYEPLFELAEKALAKVRAEPDFLPKLEKAVSYLAEKAPKEPEKRGFWGFRK